MIRDEVRNVVIKDSISWKPKNPYFKSQRKYKATDKCRIECCDRVPKAKNLCALHYDHMKKKCGVFSDLKEIFPVEPLFKASQDEDDSSDIDNEDRQ